jgi:nitroreductase
MHPTLETLHALRSTHGAFTDRPVAEEDLEAILTAATRAANASARQAYSIIVLDQRDRMEQLLGYRAARALVFCVDYHRLGRLAARLGHGFSPGDVLELLNGAVDVSLAAQNAVVAARALGIDSLVTNGLHRRPLALVYRELGLPEEGVFPLITVLLGTARDAGERGKARLPLAHVVHRDRYRSPDAAEVDALVALYDDRAARIGMVDLWDGAEYPHYLDWFFERWIGKPAEARVPTGKLKEVQDRLVASGFWWPER